MPKRKRAAPKEAGATAAEREAELHEYISTHRNGNTHATYTSGWTMFERWIDEVENPKRRKTERVRKEWLTGNDVAAYLRYLVEVKGSAIATVTGAIAAINDHLRYKIAWDFNPCGEAVVTQMRHVLIPLAKQATQKKVITIEILTTIHRATRKAKTPIGHRDSAMFMLAYYGLLRISEVVRMNRGDILFSHETVDGKQRVMMTIHVDRMCKNDKERKGHDRLVVESSDERHCVVDQMIEHMRSTQTATMADGDPLFVTATGARLSIDTPRGRAKWWLKEIGITDGDRYGFHSMRAGGATAAANAGATREQIMLHGNWKSSAVDGYIHADTNQRLKASSAMGKQ